MDEESASADDGTASSEKVAALCRELRQGDVLNLGCLPIVTSEAIYEQSYGLGVAIITQTCDLVQPRRPNVVVAPVVELNPSQAGNAKRGAMPQFVHLEHQTMDNYFVDLSHCATLTKAALTGMELIYHGVDQDDRESVGKFAARVGRRFSRFPFPDDVQPWFRPLQEQVTRRHGKESSLGKILQDVVDIRIESSNWAAAQMELIVHIIVPAGTVPNPDDFDPDDVPSSLNRQLRPDGILVESATQIASRLVLAEGAVRSILTAPERYLLWNAFAEALASLCQKPEQIGVPSAIISAVASVTGMLWTDDEFSLNRYNRTESLDLEHLSPAVSVFEKIN